MPRLRKSSLLVSVAPYFRPGSRNALPWPELLADYDLSRGRIWIAVLVVTLLAPWWTARSRGLLQR